MSDKDLSKKPTSENNGTEPQEPALPSGDKSPETTAVNNSDTAKKSSKSATTSSTKTSLPNSNANKTKNQAMTKPSNKRATIAIIIAALSIAASAGHYVWQQQQTSAQLLVLAQQNQQAIQQSQGQLKSSLTAEFNRQLQQLHQVTRQSQQQEHINSEAQLQQVTAQIAQLSQQVNQRQPSDWLIHEAEYLVRVAARTMWLERDTTAAIGLLRDADNRLKALDQSKFLPVRALINEDIEALSLMPKLTNQEAILTLMALSKQIPSLTLTSVNLAATLDEQEEDFSLSDDVADWQENLSKTWQKFLNDFITVRRRTGLVEPLMAPEQQQHLKQNLSLKVQLAQWAASEQKDKIYQQTLLDIQQWLNEFFDMNLVVNQRFNDAIEQLKNHTIYYDYPSDLRSLSAMKRLLDDIKEGATAPDKTNSTNNNINSLDQNVNANKTEAELTEKVADKVNKKTNDQAPKEPTNENAQTDGGQL